ncbi:MAG: alpha/beta fold hydrolase [Planctomycetes bacterium]|nr:alpha/beta fold hydrolase [Planctomycetota bacterium]
MSTTTFRLELDGGHHIVGDERAGDGPHYVFLHGLGSVRAGEKSASLLAHASARGRGFLRFDMRGHGDSSGQLGRVAVSELVADGVRILERTGPANVVGSSLGGLVAAHVAARRPDLVRRLALLAPAFGLMPRIRQHLDQDGFMHTSEGPSFFVEPRVRDDAESLDEQGLPTRLQVPTLLVHGSDDDIIPQQVSEWLFASIPHEHKQLWIVPGGDHRLNTVATDIWRRLDELPTDGPGDGDAR